MHERRRQPVARVAQFGPVRFNGVELRREIAQRRDLGGKQFGIGKVFAEPVPGGTQKPQVIIGVARGQARLQPGANGVFLVDAAL